MFCLWADWVVFSWLGVLGFVFVVWLWCLLRCVRVGVVCLVLVLFGVVGVSFRLMYLFIFVVWFVCGFY